MKYRQLAYLLPNFFTALSIFVGVLSIIASSQGRFSDAAWLIIISLILDGLDGRIARLTKTSSAFGVEFDSLADIVAFGAAPAMLLYFYTGHDYGRFGIVVSGLFVVFGAIRLARFNVMKSETEPSVFIGVPIPTAAVFISVWVMMFESLPLMHAYQVLLLLLALAVSLLMVSNIRYPSFKKIEYKTAHWRKIFILLVAVAALLFIYPREGVTLLITLYLLYGPLRALYYLSKKARR